MANNEVAARAANNITQDVKDLSIQEALNPYEIPDDESKLEYKHKEMMSGATQIREFINGLENLSNEQKETVTTNALAYFSANSKNVQVNYLNVPFHRAK